MASPPSQPLPKTSSQTHPAQHQPSPQPQSHKPQTPLAQRINACKRSRFLFADWDFDDETFLLACLLHGIGTTEANITATRLSFEFFGGVLALRVLRNDTHEDEDEANVGIHVRERGSLSGLRARDGPA
ncbi:unnamed protein product [Penicillium crustosum]